MPGWSLTSLILPTRTRLRLSRIWPCFSSFFSFPTHASSSGLKVLFWPWNLSLGIVYDFIGVHGSLCPTLPVHASVHRSIGSSVTLSFFCVTIQGILRSFWQSCMYISVTISVRQSVCLPVCCLSVVFLPVLYVYLRHHFRPSVWLSVCLTVCLPVSQSFNQSLGHPFYHFFWI